MVFTCGTCWREFHAGFRAREQHFEALGHQPPEFECEECDEWFQDDQDRREHMNYFGHWNACAVECRVCDQMCSDDADRNEHERKIHLYCYDCNRTFQNYNNVRQHMNSWKHRPSAVVCPFCLTTANTATGLVHHLERGSCPRAPLDRDKLYRVIRRYDPQGTISKHYIEGTDNASYVATDKAWNPWHKCYECYLCHNLFGTLHALDQHLASPRHQQAIYHCPNTECRKDSSTLAALINHLESETCGFMRFQAVQNQVHNIVNPGRRIQF